MPSRAERAWQESELRAPWYAINGFLAALAIARGRGDTVGAAHWAGWSSESRSAPTPRSGRAA